jgi:hypothetical protein
MRITIFIGDIDDRQRPHAGMNSPDISLNVRAAALARQFLRDEIFGDSRKRCVQLPQLGLPPLLLEARITALADHAEPVPRFSRAASSDSLPSCSS